MMMRRFLREVHRRRGQDHLLLVVVRGRRRGVEESRRIGPRDDDVTKTRCLLSRYCITVMDDVRRMNARRKAAVTSSLSKAS
jgi:hypothetical protein